MPAIVEVVGRIIFMQIASWLDAKKKSNGCWLLLESSFSSKGFVCTLDAHSVIYIIGLTLSYLP